VSSRVGREQRVGYPYDVLAQRSAKAIMPRGHALAASLLAGWLAYVAYETVFATVPSDERVWTLFCCVLVPLGAGFTRALLYCQALWPPISLWGRIRTGRWVLPGYDRVLLAPIAAVILGLTLGQLLRTLNAPDELVGPITVFVALWIVLAVGPTLGEWKLLGRHRAVVLSFDNTLKRV